MIRCRVGGGAGALGALGAPGAFSWLFARSTLRVTGVRYVSGVGAGAGAGGAARIFARSQLFAHRWARSPLAPCGSYGARGAYGAYGARLGAPTALLFASVTADDDPDGLTRSDKMLEISRQELKQPNSVLEKFLTFLRFLHLFVLWVPIAFIGLAVLFLFPKFKHGFYSLLVFGLQRAGPSFVKLGQWAASRGDIFPHELCLRLSQLHSNARQHSFAYTCKVVMDSLGKPLKECFSEFDEVPLGVGAMGQVYKAKKDGVEVAVKVLHPNVETTVQRDLKIMMSLAYLVNALPTMEWLSLPGEVATFGKMMQSQLDLRLEAENLNTFNRQFASDNQVSFPKVVHSTRELLVEELVDGVSMEKVLKFCKQPCQFDKDVAALGLNTFLKMVLLNNFIHSDLHAGNIFLTLNGNTKATNSLKKATTQKEWDEIVSNIDDIEPHLWFIDAGLVTELNEVNEKNFIELFKAIATFDGYKAGELMVAKSRTPETALNTEVFCLKTERLVNQVKKRTFALGSVGIGDLLNSMLEMVRKHHVRMESDFITVVISILLLEGIGRTLDPDLDIFKSALPVLRKVSPGENLSFEDLLQLAKVWVMLEGRQFLTASVQDIYRCVKYDRLSPNN